MGRFEYLRWRWGRLLTIMLAVMAAVAVLGAGSVYGYARWRLDQIHRVQLDHLSKTVQAAAPTPGPSPAAPPTSAPAPPGAFTMLLVGSDSRAALNRSGDSAAFGSAADVSGQRSDTIMLVRVDPAAGTMRILSVPRDTWAKQPAGGYGRINSAFGAGPDALVQAITDNFGIAVNHYAEVDFDTFRQAVDALGGIHVWFPTPAKDAYSGLNIPAAGCYDLNGDQALQYVRARHYTYEVGGAWYQQAQSDLARIARQQAFVKEVLHKAEQTAPTDPFELNGLIGSVTANLTVDSGMSTSMMLSLAESLRHMNTATVSSQTLATTPAVIGGADVLLPEPAANQAQIAEFLTGTPPGPPARSAPTTLPAPAASAPSTAAPAATTTTLLPGGAGPASCTD